MTHNRPSQGGRFINRSRLIALVVAAVSATAGIAEASEVQPGGPAGPIPAGPIAAGPLAGQADTDNENGDLPTHDDCDGNDFDEPACAHYSTARDLAALARYALDDPLFAQIVNRDSWTPFSWLDQSTGLWPHPVLTNTNDLIVDGDSQFYEGAYGVKTGTTDMAGSNLVSAAARTYCEGDSLCEPRDVIAVVLGSSDDGSRLSDSRRLLDFGLSR